MENTFNQGHDMINLSDHQRFVNCVAEIAEGDFHPSNIKYRYVGDYARALDTDDLSEIIFYEIAHEKQVMRTSMFMHMISPFWATYDPNHTKLSKDKKFIIFLKVLNEVRNVFTKDEREEILFAVQQLLDVSDELSAFLLNGKMWHDFYLKGYEEYVNLVRSNDSKGLYF